MQPWERISQRRVKMSVEAQIPPQRSGFAFLGHTPPPVSKLAYLLSASEGGGGTGMCVHAPVYLCTHARGGVCVCVFIQTDVWKGNILHSITHHQTYTEKLIKANNDVKEVSCSPPSPSCVIQGGSGGGGGLHSSAHTDVERSWLIKSNQALITRRTPFTISSERGGGGGESRAGALESREGRKPLHLAAFYLVSKASPNKTGLFSVLVNFIVVWIPVQTHTQWF